MTTDSAIRPELKPLHDAMVEVLAKSRLVEHHYAEMLDRKEARGLPTPGEWPGSPELDRRRAEHGEWGDESGVWDHYREPVWTELMREWSVYYRDWFAAIVDAEKLASSPAVSAIMDAGEPRPVQKWTAQTSIALKKLAAALHPAHAGGDDGLGFIRCGLPPLPPNFRAAVEDVNARFTELHSIGLGEPDNAEPSKAWTPEGVEAHLLVYSKKNDWPGYAELTKRVGARHNGCGPSQTTLWEIVRGHDDLSAWARTKRNGQSVKAITGGVDGRADTAARSTAAEDDRIERREAAWGAACDCVDTTTRGKLHAIDPKDPGAAAVVEKICEASEPLLNDAMSEDERDTMRGAVAEAIERVVTEFFRAKENRKTSSANRA